MTDFRPQPQSHEPAPADRDWFGGRRWTGIAAIAVIIVLVVCVVILVITRKNNNDNNNGQGSRPNQTAAASTAPTSRPSSSPLPTTIPTVAPAGTTWSIFETVALPTIPGQGPAKVTADGIATGYAHTPTGALLATANSSFRYVLVGDAAWRRAVSEMLAPGAGTNAWIKTRTAGQYGPGGASGSGDSFAQVAGYQFVSYTPSDAVIQIVTRDSDGNLQVGADHVSWNGTDWLFVPAPDGGVNSNSQQVDSLDGFIEWHGV